MAANDPTHSRLNAKVWVNDAVNYKYPERDFGFAQNTGVCFSGGGTRALTAASGQMRGLTHLSLMEKVDYISCVSGGSWASGAYTYYKSNPHGNRGPIDDERFLGPVTEPGDIQVKKPQDEHENWLGYDGPERLGTTATQSLLRTMGEVILGWAVEYLEHNWSLDWIEAFENIPWDRVWIEAVGRVYYQPFGLYEPFKPFAKSPGKNQPYFSLSEETVEDIRSRNPGTSLVDAEFFTVRNEPKGPGHQPQLPRRPYLIIDSCMIGPSGFEDFKNEQLVRFEYTPLYVGSAYSPHDGKLTYGRGSDQVELRVGGGFVEPFAFSGSAPPSPPHECSSPEPQGLCTEVPTPAVPYTLVEASGTSSAAFAVAIENNPVAFVKRLQIHGFLKKFGLRKLLDYLQSSEGKRKKLSPQEKFWPVTAEGGEPTTSFSFGDGGSLENYGLITLLRRKVKRVIVFINTSMRLNPGYDGTTKPTRADIDSNLPPLFGYDDPYPGINTSRNQVFPKGELAGVVQALNAQQSAGETVMAIRTHTVAENTWWGVEGVKLDDGGNRADPNAPVTADQQVSILWVYNARVKNWEDKLTTEKFDAEDLGMVTLKEAIEKGNPATGEGEGPFVLFPNYKTVGENDWSLVELTPMQVNLLADLSCWNIASNQQVFEDFLDMSKPVKP